MSSCIILRGNPTPSTNRKPQCLSTHLLPSTASPGSPSEKGQSPITAIPVCTLKCSRKMLAEDQDRAFWLPPALELLSHMGCQSSCRTSRTISCAFPTGLLPQQGNEGVLTSVWPTREQGSFPGRAERISLQGWWMFCFRGQRIKPSHQPGLLHRCMHSTGFGKMSQHREERAEMDPGAWVRVAI